MRKGQGSGREGRRSGTMHSRTIHPHPPPLLGSICHPSKSFLSPFAAVFPDEASLSHQGHTRSVAQRRGSPGTSRAARPRCRAQGSLQSSSPSASERGRTLFPQRRGQPGSQQRPSALPHTPGFISESLCSRPWQHPKRLQRQGRARSPPATPREMLNSTFSSPGWDTISSSDPAGTHQRQQRI